MKIETFEKTIKVDEFIEGYVNVEEFLECCKVCENYEQVWSCPTYDFDPVDYWKRFENLYVVGKKMILEAVSYTHLVTELVKAEAKRYGVVVTGTEIIGLCPMKALVDSAEYYLQIKDFDFHTQVLENHIL